MSRSLRYAIIEDLETTPRIPLGTLLGVRVTATPIAWLSPFVFFALRAVLNLFVMRATLPEELKEAALFSLAVQITNPAHAFGHIVSGKLVGSPMDELLITATRDVNIYHGDQQAVPSRVHLARALGGPLMNLIVAGVSRRLLHTLQPGLAADILTAIASTNRFYGFGGLLPLPSIDGAVIWREMLRMARPGRRTSA